MKKHYFELMMCENKIWLTDFQLEQELSLQSNQ